MRTFLSAVFASYGGNGGLGFSVVLIGNRDAGNVFTIRQKRGIA